MKSIHMCLLFVVMFLVVGCTSESFSPQSSGSTMLTPTVDTTTYPWAYSWMDNPSCQPPCWEGIVPGKTPPEEALALLHRVSYIRASTIYDDRVQDFHQITWRWDTLDSTAIGRMYVYDGVVQRIMLSFPGFTSLDRLVRTYGEPSHVSARDINFEGSKAYWLSFLFHQHKFTFGPYLGKNPPTISKDMILENEIQLFDQDIEEHTSITQRSGDSINKQFWVPWQGAQDFDFYQKQLPD